jgi:hypothetical protein
LSNPGNGALNQATSKPIHLEQDSHQLNFAPHYQHQLTAKLVGFATSEHANIGKYSKD